jgi:aryl-alcohol dehydrogenase-like predicted oxidoreductase
MSQIQWSLAVSSAEAQGDTTKVVMDEREYGGYLKQHVPVMAYSSQAKGFFAKSLTGTNGINRKSQDWFVNPENLQRLERVKAYAARTGLTPNTVALGYVLCNRLAAMALVGCRSLEQLKSTMAAADVSIPEADLDSFIET